MGQQGYAFISGIGGLNDQVNLDYRDSAHANAIISYESDTAPTNITALLDLLNRRGSQGWAYKGDLAMGVNDARSVRQIDRRVCPRRRQRDVLWRKREIHFHFRRLRSARRRQNSQ